MTPSDAKTSKRPRLSILVAGLYERMPSKYTSGWTVVERLVSQAHELPEVEVLTLYDTRRMSVGRKRDILLKIAQGEYLAYVDDDDEVAADYVDKILEAITKSNGADVITFRQDCIRGDLGGRVERCRYGLSLAYRNGTNPDGSLWWEGKPSHTCVWRTDLVQAIDWEDVSFGEDMAWVKRAAAVAKTEYWIPNFTAYTYHFDPERSRTRGR